MSESKIETWSDGEEVICEVCKKPIRMNEARYKTTSEKKEKRSAKHFACDPASKAYIL